MATPRRPLGQLSTNITPFKDLAPYIRGRIIIGKAEEEKTPAQNREGAKAARFYRLQNPQT